MAKKICKGCGSTGFFLKLNAEQLCPKCEKYRKTNIGKPFESMPLEELASELAAYVNGKDISEKVQKEIEAYERHKNIEEAHFSMIFGNYTKARELEKAGNVDEALAIYRKLLKKNPTGTDYFIRPCIILEKKKEYQEAIDICDMAIDAIEKEKFNADTEEFIHRKERLIKKLAKQMS